MTTNTQIKHLLKFDVNRFKTTAYCGADESNKITTRFEDVTCQQFREQLIGHLNKKIGIKK